MQFEQWLKKFHSAGRDMRKNNPISHARNEDFLKFLYEYCAQTPDELTALRRDFRDAAKGCHATAGRLTTIANRVRNIGQVDPVFFEAYANISNSLRLFATELEDTLAPRLSKKGNRVEDRKLEYLFFMLERLKARGIPSPTKVLGHLLDCAYVALEHRRAFNPIEPASIARECQRFQKRDPDTAAAIRLVAHK
jgi:hypothetical protein